MTRPSVFTEVDFLSGAIAREHGGGSLCPLAQASYQLIKGQEAFAAAGRDSARRASRAIAPLKKSTSVNN